MNAPSGSAPVAVVGCGLVGRAWALVFARGGHEVRLYDAGEGAVAQALAFADVALAGMHSAGLLDGESAETVRARLHAAASLDAAVDGVVHVQESTFEKIELKREVFARLDAAAPPDAVIASSTSALLPSHFTETLAGRERCLVAHPINPPYLVPAVEVVPAPWTSADACERTRVLLEAVGQSPIMMQRELDGFVVNRLQGALLHEAFRLVSGGYASAEDVDRAVRDGLGLRWSFMGPFETIDLNAPGGIRDYIERFEGMYQAMAPTQAAPVAWSGALADQLERERAALLPRTALAERQTWRDRRLMALAAHRRQVADAHDRDP